MRHKNWKIRQLTDMFELLMSPKTADRLFVFFADAPLPSDLEIFEIAQEHMKAVELVHVQGGDKTPQEQIVVEFADSKVHSVIRKYGGISEFRAVFRHYTGEPKTKERAKILKYFSYIGGTDITTVKDIANKVHLSVRQTYRQKDEALDQIARELINRQRERGKKK